MKTFKQFLVEAERTEKEDFSLYYNFVANVLKGNNNGADQLYKANRLSIDSIAAKLRKRYPTSLKKIYRGMLLDDKFVKNNMFDPMHKIQYMSFSEHKLGASEFADPHSWMSQIFMMGEPNAKGYMIEYHPKPKEILFHWRWAEIVGITRLPDLEMHDLMRQAEVIIKQTGQKLSLIPWDRSKLG